MTDIQFGLLLTTLVAVAGTIAGAIKWAVGRITKALDDNTSSNVLDAEAKVKLADWIERHPTPVRGVPITTAPPMRDPGPTPRGTTQGGGGYHERRPTDPRKR